MWKVKEHEVLDLGRVNVVNDLVSKDNNHYFKFTYVEIKSGVCILPMIDDHFIVIKQYRHSLKNYQWELPAGGIDGDESPIDAAIRETEEEIGYEVNKIFDLGSFHPSPGSTNEEIFLFAAQLGHQISRKLDELEDIEVYKLSKNQLISLVKKNELKHGAALACISRYFIGE